MTDRDLFKPYKSLFSKKNQNKDMTPYTNPLYNLHSPSIQKKILLKYKHKQTIFILCQ